MRPGFANGLFTGIVLALLVSAVSASWAGSGVGGVFNLGKKNAVDHQTILTGKAPVSMLKVHDGGGGTAATFSVDPGVPPFTVDSPTKVENLNADSLDGMDSSAFLGSVVVVRATKTVAAGESHGDYIVCPEGYEALNGGVYSEEAAVVETIDSFPEIREQPFFAPHSWSATARNIGNSSHEFVWYAVCSPEGGRP